MARLFRSRLRNHVLALAYAVHTTPDMKRLGSIVIASLVFIAGVDGHAQRHRNGTRATKKEPRTKKRRARSTPQPQVNPLAASADEVALSPTLLRQLQRNLIEGGYLDGTVDGRLSRRTRRALTAFQREYHLAPTGALDRATAEALLGHDVIGAYFIADAQHEPHHK